MTDEPAIQLAVAHEYLALADLLVSASEAEWDTPSLCEGWRVREVVADVTMPARYDHGAFMAELEARDFDFGRLSNEIAARDSQLPTEELVANLRAEVLHEWTPPGSDHHAALNHVVIHGLDVTVPLGVRPSPPEKTMRIVLDDLTEGGVHAHFGTVLTGRRLEATDINWAYGSGSPLCGSSGDLALAICGRSMPPGRLDGDPL